MLIESVQDKTMSLLLYFFGQKYKKLNFTLGSQNIIIKSKDKRVCLKSNVLFWLVRFDGAKL